MSALVLGTPLLPALAVAAIHARGERSLARIGSRERARSRRVRAAAFYVALVTLVAALAPGVDSLAHKLFWAHMVQHLLLALVVAPLVVYAAPWTPIWRAIPLHARRRFAAQYVHAPAWQVLRRVGRVLTAPVVAWLLFNVDLCVWHIPGLYGLTLRNGAVHELEHVSFLVFGVVLWMQVVDSPPLRARLDDARRVVYMVLAATVAWGLAVVLAFAPSPLYAAYAHEASRPGGLSALGDQQLAAGMMWGPGSVPYALVVFFALYRWLGAPRRVAAPRATR